MTAPALPVEGWTQGWTGSSTVTFTMNTTVYFPTTTTGYYTTTPSVTMSTGTSNGWVSLGYIGDEGLATTPLYARPVYTMDDVDGRQGNVQLTPQSDEEIARQEAALEERLQASREAAVAREAAEERARELLLSLLPEDQKEPYRLTGVFEIIGSHGTRYRIRRGVAGNIDWLDAEGRVGGNLCCHAPQVQAGQWIPVADVMVGQVLALKADEPAFLRVANGRKPPVAAR